MSQHGVRGGGAGGERAFRGMARGGYPALPAGVCPRDRGGGAGSGRVVRAGAGGPDDRSGTGAKAEGDSTGRYDAGELVRGAEVSVIAGFAIDALRPGERDRSNFSRNSSAALLSSMMKI